MKSPAAPQQSGEEKVTMDRADTFWVADPVFINVFVSAVLAFPAPSRKKFIVIVVDLSEAATRFQSAWQQARIIVDASHGPAAAPNPCVTRNGDLCYLGMHFTPLATTCSVRA
jgi:hypothetical protein